MSIANKNFLLAGDLLILDNEATNTLLFNKKIVADYDMSLPYELVKSGKWTFDAFNAMVRQVSEDLNGDGAMSYKNDRFGFAVFVDTLHALLQSGGGAIALKDEKDIPYMTLTTERNLQVIDKAMDIMYNHENVINVCNVAEDWYDMHNSYHALFEEGRALFLWARLRLVERFRNMDDEFGIVPMPKFDEAQADYLSPINPWTGALICVPKTVSNTERTSIIIEALAAESRYTLRPAYYDVTLQRKYTRDDESNEMLNIIFNSRVYDLGATYSFGDIASPFVLLADKNEKRDIVSFYEKYEPRAQKAIDNIVDIFESLD